MEPRWWLVGIGLAGWLAAGCDKAEVSPPSAATASVPPAPVTTNPVHLDRAQPKLQTMKLWVGNQELVTELAVSPTEVATGMMFRQEMAENEGMLFVFGRPHRAAFYMKNTYVPLSCAYIATDGTILEIHDMRPLDETAIEADSDQIQYVLEVKQGWFDRHKVPVGTVVRTEFGSLPETFLKRAR